MADTHEWKLSGGGGGWEVWECPRCGLWGFGGCWWQRFLTRIWPTRYGCMHRIVAADAARPTEEDA